MTTKSTQGHNQAFAMHHLHVRRFYDVVGALNRKTRMVRFLCPGCKTPTDKVLADVVSALKKNPRIYCSAGCSAKSVEANYAAARAANSDRHFFVDTKPMVSAQIGEAGELLAMADLTLKGYAVTRAPPGCVFDLLAFVDGYPFRIQVKTASGHRAAIHAGARDNSYKFKICKTLAPTGTRTGNRGYKRYADHEFDILALVGLDTHDVAYVGTKPVSDSYKLLPNSYKEFCARPVARFSNFTIETALAATRTRLGL